MPLFGKSKKQKAQEELVSLQVNVPRLALACLATLVDKFGITDADTRWKLHTEVLSLLCHIVSRWAFEIGGPEFRNQLQDAVTLHAVDATVELSWAPPATMSQELHSAWQRRMKDELLHNINVIDAEFDQCKSLMGSEELWMYDRDSIAGKFIANAVQLLEDDPEIRLFIGLAVAHTIAHPRFRQSIELIWKNTV